jgi:transcriptional regulator with XRE-family HTH domain
MARLTPNLSTILLQRREALGLTPVAAARRAGVSLGGLRNIEAGRRPTPRFHTVAKLARAYAMALDELAAGTDPSP